MSARYVFKLARDDSRITYHVYCSAALMEYFCSKVGVFCSPFINLYFIVCVYVVLNKYSAIHHHAFVEAWEKLLGSL